METIRFCHVEKFIKTASGMHVAPRISQSLYLAVLGSTWLYLAAPGCTWLYMIVSDCTWLYLVVLGSTWLYLAVPGCTWLYLAVPGCTVVWLDPLQITVEWFWMLKSVGGAYRIKRENGKIDQAKKSHLMGWNGIYHGYWCRHHHRSMHYRWEGQVLTGKLSWLNSQASLAVLSY